MFLKKLDYLINKKGINKNILATQSGIPYTTIDGFYKKGYENIKLSTLMKLCKYFDVSLDYLVKDDNINIQETKNNELTPHEQKVITAYRKKSPEAKEIIDAALGIEPEQFSIAEDIKNTTEVIEAMIKQNNKTKS